MSDADSEAITVTAEGITVRKTVDTEQFQTLAVVLELASERDGTARVQLVDPIPRDVPMEDVGFHPQYGSEHWSVEDAAVAFERDLEPGEAYTTIYGIRDYPEDEIDALLEEPAVGLVDTESDGLDEVIDEERSEVVREFLAGEADLPGLEAEVAVDADAAEAPREPAEASDDGAEPAPAEATANVDAEPETEAEPPADAAPAADTAAIGEAEDGREIRVPLTGGVVRVLIKELRDGDVDPEDRRMLRDELLDTEGSTEARLAHLQQRVSDLEAYADALEAFIDEEGTAEAIISELRDDVAGLERSVRATDDRVDQALEELASVDDRLETVADDVATIESRGAMLEDRVEDLEEEIASVDERADDLGARVDQVSADVDGVDDQANDLAARVDDLRDELDAVVADLRDFETFRERLTTVFGGADQSFDDETTEE